MAKEELVCDDRLEDLDCAKAGTKASFFTWLNSLKNKVYDLCECIVEITPKLGTGLYIVNNTAKAFNETEQFMQLPLATSQDINSPVRVANSTFRFKRDACVIVSITKEIQVGNDTLTTPTRKMYSLARLALGALVSADLQRHSRIREEIRNDESSLDESMNDSSTTALTLFGAAGTSFAVESRSHLINDGTGTASGVGTERLSVQVTEIPCGCLDN